METNVNNNRCRYGLGFYSIHSISKINRINDIEYVGLPNADNNASISKQHKSFPKSLVCYILESFDGYF